MKTSLFISVYTERGARDTLSLYFTQLLCAHNHFITASLPSNSYIFCTSDPHHMDRATSTVSLLSSLSLAICAHQESIFRNRTHTPGCKCFLHMSLRGLFIYLSYLWMCCPLTVSCSSLRIYCKSLRTFLIGHQE